MSNANSAKLCWHHTTKVSSCPGNANPDTTYLSNDSCKSVCEEIKNEIQAADIEKPTYLTPPIADNPVIDGVWQKKEFGPTEDDPRPVGFYFILNSPPSGNLDDGRLSQVDDSTLSSEADIIAAYNWVTTENPTDSPLCVFRCKELLIGDDDIFSVNFDPSPPFPRYPADSDYEICYKSCVEEYICKYSCAENNNDGYDEDKCNNLCEYVMDAPRGIDPNNTENYKKPLIDCNTTCPVVPDNPESCSDYWTPQIKLTVKTGLGTCSESWLTDTDRKTFTVDWQSSDINKRNPVKEVSPTSNTTSTRSYQAGLDGGAICVYDLGEKYLDGLYTEQEGANKNRISGANQTVKADDPELAAYDAVNNSDRICYDLPLAEGPAPCCTTLALSDSEPEIVNLDPPSSFYFSEEIDPPVTEINGLTGYSEFVQPRIRVQFASISEAIYTDLTWTFPDIEELKLSGQADQSAMDDNGCQQLDYDNGMVTDSRIFCPIMINNNEEICVYEKIRGNQAIVKGCYPRNMQMPYNIGSMAVTANNLGTDENDNPIYSTFYEPKIKFSMNDGLGNFRSVILSPNEQQECDYIFGHRFCATSTIHPKTQQKVLCMQGVYDENGILVVSPANVIGTTELSEDGANDLCVRIPPEPCPAEIANLTDIAGGYASWNETFIDGENNEVIAYANPDPSFEHYYQTHNITDQTSYCPPGYQQSNGIPQRVCKLEGNIGVWQDVDNPCQRSYCPNIAVSDTAASPYNSTDGRYHTSWPQTEASLYLPYDNIFEQPDYYVNVNLDGIKSTEAVFAQEIGNGDNVYCNNNNFKDPDTPPIWGCQHDGNWLEISDISPICQPKSCDAGYIDIAQANFPSSNIGSTVTATSCASGYMINNNGNMPTINCIAGDFGQSQWDYSSIQNICVSKCQPETYQGYDWAYTDKGGFAVASCQNNTTTADGTGELFRQCLDDGSGWDSNITNNCGCAEDVYEYSITGLSGTYGSMWGFTEVGGSQSVTCQAGGAVATETIEDSYKVKRYKADSQTISRTCNIDGWQQPTGQCLPYAEFDVDLDGFKVVNFHRISQIFTASVLATHYSQRNMNDDLEEITIKEGYVEICTDDNFSGSCIILGAGTYALSAPYKNEISSIRSVFKP
ncbi:MAG: hypothetical protein AAF195_00995 [Pseudomonadota bacterium]